MGNKDHGKYDHFAGVVDITSKFRIMYIIQKGLEGLERHFHFSLRFQSHCEMDAWC